MKMRVRSLALLSGLSGVGHRYSTDVVLLWLWCRLAAVSCSSNSTPSLGTSICRRCGPKKQKIRIKKYIHICILKPVPSPSSDLKDFNELDAPCPQGTLEENSPFPEDRPSCAALLSSPPWSAQAKCRPRPRRRLLGGDPGGQGLQGGAVS